VFFIWLSAKLSLLSVRKKHSVKPTALGKKVNQHDFKNIYQDNFLFKFIDDPGRPARVWLGATDYYR
jgi:hypothetical protein